MKALLLDFEDSFTFNVVQELANIGLKVEVIKWDDFNGNESFDLLVLGPGPGHPDDYQSLYPLIQKSLDSKKKIFAVCLGHQILWRMMKRPVVKSLHPQHGQQVEVILPPGWQQWLGTSEKILVQRYNSLGVPGSEEEAGLENLIHEGEILISRGKNILSYQFHPESVGTKCRHAFFRPILRDLL